MKNSRFLTHTPIDFVFIKNAKNFTVEEIPLYPFSGNGEHTVVTIRKKDMTTWAMLETLSCTTGAKLKDIGYAGLKDKEAMTIQHVSIPKAFEDALKNVENPNIKILNTTRHNNKIKLGHLIGNKFVIRLKKITPTNFAKIKNALSSIQELGMPNYFGYQRFGNDGNNHLSGRDIVLGIKKEKNQNLKRFFLSAYQSKLFNDWLSFRISMSHIVSGFDGKELQEALSSHFGNKNIALNIDAKGLRSQSQFFKILKGDVMCHYPHGKLFFAEDEILEGKRFEQKQISPTGLLCGDRDKKSTEDAFEIERPFVDENIKALGDRRYAWIFPNDCDAKYDEEEAHAILRFTLQKGSYATVLLEEVLGETLAKGGGEYFLDE